MDKKLIAVISYITIVGWVIAYILNQDTKNKSDLATFHLRQTFGLFLSGLIVYVAAQVITEMPILGFMGTLVSIAGSVFFFILWLLGLMYALQGEKKPVPVLGIYFEEKITFIN